MFEAISRKSCDPAPCHQPNNGRSASSVIPMADWQTISSLATAGGTLVLAAATFSAVRSGNRAARIAERSFLAGLRPVLFPSRFDDPPQKIRWGDDHWERLEGARAVVDVVDDVIYLAASLRNVGAGIAVLHGWRIEPDIGSRAAERPDIADFRPQGRDLYVPSGDIGFWQAAIRNADDPSREPTSATIARGDSLMVDLLYGDHEGGQRTISRFTLSGTPDKTSWLCSVVRHWNVDRAEEPRPAVAQQQLPTFNGQQQPRTRLQQEL